MTEFHAGQFDIAVVGAGHAGIEAALAAARLGLETIVFTINLDAVGNMPCNPAIGGTGKGRLAPAGPGGPAALPGVHGAHPGAAGSPDRPAGRGH